MLRKLSLLLSAPLLVLAFAGCTDSVDEAVTISENTVILDVRTPEEFATGHLEGAQLLDLNSGEFEAALPELNPSAEYLVYCRSGNRSGQAIELMKDAGFTDLTNLGSVEEAAEATEIPIVS